MGMCELGVGIGGEGEGDGGADSGCSDGWNVSRGETWAKD